MKTPPRGGRALPYTVGGYASPTRRGLLPPPFREGVCRMVTYEQLFLFATVIISTVSLVIQITKKK